MKYFLFTLFLVFSSNLFAGFADLLVFKIRINDTEYYSPIECWGKLDEVNEVIFEDGQAYSYTNYYKNFAKYSVWKSIYLEYSEISFPEKIRGELDSLDHVHEYVYDEVFNYSESLNDDLEILEVLGFTRCTFVITPILNAEQIEDINSGKVFILTQDRIRDEGFIFIATSEIAESVVDELKNALPMSDKDLKKFLDKNKVIMISYWDD